MSVAETPFERAVDDTLLSQQLDGNLEFAVCVGHDEQALRGRQRHFVGRDAPGRAQRHGERRQARRPPGTVTLLPLSELPRERPHLPNGGRGVVAFDRNAPPSRPFPRA